jgi:LmbE family N-acetylglucosaminyl deacetylase
METVATEIAHFIRKLKPQVVITFDPIGGYRHPDHIAIHNATVEAFKLASSSAFAAEDLLPYQPQKLYFHVMPHGMLRAAVFLMRLTGQDPRRVGTNKDIDLVSITEVSFPTHARIDFRPVAKIRDEASACHASQGGGRMIGGPVLGQLRRWFAASENYMRAYPEPAPGTPIERDLFEGIPG